MHIQLKRLALSIGLVLVAMTLNVLLVRAQEATEVTATTEPSAPQLVGVTWQWVHFADGAQEMDVPTPDYTLTFTDEGNLFVRADCNRGRGTYTTDDPTLSIGPIASTLAMCPPGSLSNDFLNYLNQVAVYSFSDDGTLLLELPADSGTLTFQAQPQVTGTVSYLVRMALPDDAVLRVQIQDVSLADAPSVMLGEQIIVTDGAQVPIPFAVSYPASSIEENKRYSLSARITDAQGRLLFISDTVVPVITGGNPTSDIDIVLVRVS